MGSEREWPRAGAVRSSSGVVREGVSASPPEALPVQRRNRLSRSRDFDTVYRRGQSASTRYLVLHWFPRDEDMDGVPRLGLAVPRSVGSAVVRNRVKRLLREAWREPSRRCRRSRLRVGRPSGFASQPRWVASGFGEIGDV
jgi:ribonuclease P protein component